MAQAEKTFYEKFLTAQAEFPKLQKDGENPHFRSAFVTLDNILDKVVPVLNRNGIMMSQGVTTLKGEPALKTMLTDGTDVIETTMLLMMKSADPQGQGSAITYARRYSLMAILGLSAGEDDDGNSANEAENARQEQERQLYRELSPQTKPSAVTEFMQIIKDKGVGSKEEAVIILDIIEPNWKKLNTSGISRVKKELVLMGADTMQAILKGEL